ncbi:hypothetical protein ABH09_09505 [Treponema sp. OMZ 803]|uniref:hypothetical protein n=1 Tax=Treponema sp. OMZ 803 TaxID=120682 RepID=UPI0020A2CA44|nr:hypothetical protein [Treponema sp. OMZ 803]UTC52572.1 hypothetical protein ABH09_09505 [Treponema sp. OMZ 803]
MKKQYVNSVSILLAMLCLAFTACNGMLTGGDTGTVRVVIGGGTARSVDGKGLPALNEKNTVITITDEEGTALARETTSVTVTLPIGTKITVKAVVTTAAGEWHGSEKHTVTAGDNFIAVKLSKTLKVAANLLFSITGKDSLGSNIVSLSTQNGTKLLDGILIGTKPRTARDRIGRLYVLYDDISSARHLKRFDVEGNEDAGFEAALTTVLAAAGVAIGNIDNIAIDQDDNYIFLFKQKTVYCFKEKDDHSFKSFGEDDFLLSSTEARAVAVDHEVLFAVCDQTLFAGEFEFVNLPTPGNNKTLKFKSATPARQNLDKLRSNFAFGNDLPDCTGLFADDDGVYCLLTQRKEEAGKKYALGQLVRYEYSGSALTKKTEIGLNPAAPTADPIAFNAQYFSNPIGFIGYDEDNIYIADDGVNIEYLNENWRINGNKNRIAAFNRGNDSLSFSDSGATWFTEHAVYKKPNTKILLWEKQSPAMVLSPMNYWISTDGTEAFSATNKLFEDSVQPTDVFCYDQDGNLYILWKGSSGYNVRRFALKEDGTYNKPGVDLTLTSYTVPTIAVDVSDGKNYLYYVYEDGSNKHIQRYSWNSTSFDTATLDSTYGVHINSQDIFFTALAANKDGVFVGTRAMNIAPAGYTLSVKKYAKQDGADKGTIDVGAFQPTPTEPDSPYPPYTKIMSAINDLQILDGVLYAITSKEEYGMKKTSFGYKADTFKNSGKLYKIGSTKDGFSGSAVELAKKDPVDTAGNEVGYGFYRFIAVKYDEAERIRLIIASDGAWGKDGTVISPKQPYCKNADKVLEYDLKGSLQGEQNSGGSFSKVLQESGFEWN